MNILKKIGKGIVNTTAVATGIAAGFGFGALQTVAEEAITAFIDNMF